MAPPVGVKPPVISAGTAPMAPVGVPPIVATLAAPVAPTAPTTPVTSGGRTSWRMVALWRTLAYPAIYAASALLSPEAKDPLPMTDDDAHMWILAAGVSAPDNDVPPMTDAAAHVWLLPKQERDLKLGIDRTSAQSQLRTQWKDLLRTDFASPSTLREKIAAVFARIDAPHSALELAMLLYNRAVPAGWSEAEQAQFIEIIQSETAAVWTRFNAAMEPVRSGDAALFTASQDTVYPAGTSTSTGQPLDKAVTVSQGFTFPRPSASTCQNDAGPCELATIYSQAHLKLLQQMMAERNTLAVLFEDYLAWAEESGAAEAVIAQARCDYVRMFQKVFPAHVKKLADDLHTDDIELRLAAMTNEFRHESRGVWQAFTDQLQFWRMAGDRGEVGHFIVLLLLLEGTLGFGGAFRRSRLEAHLAPARQRVDLAKRLVSEAEDRVIRASSRMKQIEAACSAQGGGDDQQGQHQFSQAEKEAAQRELNVAAAELADRRAELEDAIAAVMGDDPKRQHRARLLWRATQRSRVFQLPWGAAFAVATALILASIQVADNGDPIPLLDPQSRASWRVK